MKYFLFIIFICLLNQGCSTKNSLPINNPTGNIQAIAPAAVEDATQAQPIAPEISDSINQPIDANDVVFDNGKQLEAPKQTQDDSSEMKNMSDTSDFMPEPRSYWM